jgi:hypothetical protein
LLDVQDGLVELGGDHRLMLERDAEQVHATARNAVGVLLHHLSAAWQVLAVLETRDCASGGPPGDTIEGLPCRTCRKRRMAKTKTDWGP